MMNVSMVSRSVMILIKYTDQESIAAAVADFKGKFPALHVGKPFQKFFFGTPSIHLPLFVDAALTQPFQGEAGYDVNSSKGEKIVLADFMPK